jgi:hypothetical protein
MNPAGYGDGLAKSSNLLVDPRLREYYDQVNLITRSPSLFSGARLRAIVGMNTGAYSSLVNRPYYRYNGSLVTLDEVSKVQAGGTPGDSPVNYILTKMLAISCDDLVGRRYLNVTLESDDSYRIWFVKANQVVTYLDLGPIPPHRRKPGLEDYTADVPGDAVTMGFDTIVVTPVAGDGHFALGHLLVEKFAKTDPTLYKKVAIRDGLVGPAR